jgi:nucleotide-binding universal stress UspA family protein
VTGGAGTEAAGIASEERDAMRRILVAVDGSECAQRALEHVIAQARKHPLEVRLAYANLVPANYASLRDYLRREENRKFTDSRTRQALGPAARRLARAKVPHRAVVLWGDVAPQLARAARRLKCDSIVMGTRGMGAVGNLLLGSVAAKVVHLSHVPVTLVR